MAYSVVVLVSGSGTLLQSLIDSCADPEWSAAHDVHIAAVGADRAGAYGLERARAAGIPTFVVPLSKGDDRSVWDRALTDAVAAYAPDLVVSAGFMKLVGPAFLERFGGRIINTHPALLPSFPGTHGVRDALAYLREESEYLNLTLVEQPNGDFADTIVRQFLFDAWQYGVYGGLASSTDAALAAIAAKGHAEAAYHLRYSGGWLERLGDGTPESHARAARALANLWPFVNELFVDDDVDRAAAAAGCSPGSMIPVTGVQAPVSERRMSRVRSRASSSTTAVTPESHSGAGPTFSRSSRMKSGIATPPR